LFDSQLLVGALIMSVVAVATVTTLSCTTTMPCRWCRTQRLEPQPSGKHSAARRNVSAIGWRQRAWG